MKKLNKFKATGLDRIYHANISRVFVLLTQLLQLCLRQFTPGHMIYLDIDIGQSTKLFSRFKESFQYRSPDNILRSKLDLHVISRNSLKCFQSYLENDTQQCSVGESLSESRVLTCGVPQETILGLLYINDLPKWFLNSEPTMSADDTHLTYANNEVGSVESCLI